MNAKKAQLIINAYPVLVLSNEWLEELFCPKYGSSLVYVIKHDKILTRCDGHRGSLGAGPTWIPPRPIRR